MSNAVTSLGIIVAVGDAQGGPYTDIAELRDIDLPELTRNLIDVSTHNNTTFFEEILPSALKRISEMSFMINYLAANATHDEDTGLLALQLNATKKHFQVRFPAASGNKDWRFAGYVIGFKPSGQVDGAQTANVRIKPTDYMTIT